MKRIAALFTVLCLVLTLMGCKSPENVQTSTVVKDDSRISIGMSFDSFVIERWQRDKEVFVSTAKELGAEVNVQNANGDISKQREQIEYFVSKGVDAIVIVCIDSNGLSDVVRKAKDAGIKVIAYDRLINDANVDLYISFDNEMVGTMMGRALVNAGLTEGSKVLMLGGSQTDNNVSLVENGFLSSIEESGAVISGSMHCEGWRAELAADYIYEHEELVAEADAIMCGNDNLATQVVHALAESRLAGEVMVVGQDADLEACQRIVEGTQVMTVYKPVEKLAARAAECTMAMIRGEALEGDDVSTIDDGSFEVPYIGMEPVSVTEDNIDEVIISSGFHLREDVYLNVPEKMNAQN